MTITALVLDAPDNPRGVTANLPALKALLRAADNVAIAYSTAERCDDVVELADALGGPVIRDSDVNAINTCIAERPDGSHLLVIGADVYVSGVFLAYGQLAVQTSFAAIGPVGEHLTGSQHVRLGEDLAGAPIQRVAATLGQGIAKASRADCLDPGCFLISSEALDRVGPLDDSLPLEWALRDWFVRLRAKRWRRPAALRNAYSARVLADIYLPLGDVQGRLAYYAKWKEHTTEADHKLVGLMVVMPQNRHQLALMKASIRSLRERIDGLLVMLAGAPEDFDQTPGPPIKGSDRKALSMDTIEARFGAWLDGYASVDVQLVDEHQRDPSLLEHFASIEATKAGATWVLRLLEGEVFDRSMVRDEIEHLMRHPDPLVVAYNVGIAVHWGSRDFVRIDQPFGDGGDRTGAPGNDFRLYRPNGARQAADGGRVANLRLRNTAQLDVEHQREMPTDQIRIAQWSPSTQLSMHMLAHDGENPDDVARWLDWLHGFGSAEIAWTSGSACEEHEVACRLAELFGGKVVGVSADGVHFAQWRNGAIVPTCWNGFVDPDEWVADPVVDLLPLRRMVESRDVWAYMVPAVNYHPDGTVTQSTSIRVWRGEVGGPQLRFTGRVHESLSASLHQAAEAAGVEDLSTKIRAAPLLLHNRHNAAGNDPERRERYLDLIRQQIEEDPTSATHLMQLAWDYIGDGHTDEAIALLDAAVDAARPSEFRPVYERGILYARMALRDLQRAAASLTPAVPQHAITRRLLAAMGSDLPGLTDAVTEPAALPAILGG